MMHVSISTTEVSAESLQIDVASVCKGVILMWAIVHIVVLHRRPPQALAEKIRSRLFSVSERQ
jgi:hypothetical protein